MHIALLGDSIFDNAVYVNPGEPDVCTQLNALLPEGSRATLLAVDGNTTHGIAQQLKRLPDDVTHLVLSVGGNNALGHLGMMSEAATSIAEVLNRLADISEGFERDYRQMLAGVLAAQLPLTLCMIYYPGYDDPLFQRLAKSGLLPFNDVIQRAAYTHGLPLIDLRLVCDEQADYANPIEPSAAGGAKIAAAVAKAVQTHNFTCGRTAVYC
jgi:lysophospholipase L1-like esterase